MRLGCVWFSCYFLFSSITENFRLASSQPLVCQTFFFLFFRDNLSFLSHVNFPSFSDRRALSRLSRLIDRVFHSWVRGNFSIFGFFSQFSSSYFGPLLCFDRYFQHHFGLLEDVYFRKIVKIAGLFLAQSVWWSWSTLTLSNSAHIFAVDVISFETVLLMDTIIRTFVKHATWDTCGNRDDFNIEKNTIFLFCFVDANFTQTKPNTLMFSLNWSF